MSPDPATPATPGTRVRVRAAIDGGSRGNPGPAGCGIVLEWGSVREEHTLFLGRATNNVAEYAALLAMLDRAVAIGACEVEAFSDSELLVHQMNGVYKVRSPHLAPLWVRAQQLARRFARFTIQHVYREANFAADRLANVAIDSQQSTLPRPAGL